MQFILPSILTLFIKFTVSDFLSPGTPVRRMFLHATCFALLGVHAVSGYAHSETLEDAIEAAFLHHPQIESASANQFAAIESINEAKSSYMGDINLSVQGGRMYANTTTTRGLTTTRGAAFSGLFEASASFNQPLYDGFETYNRVNAAEARADSADLNIQTVRELLGQETVRAYLDILRGRRIKNMLISQMSDITSYKDRIEKMIQDGGASESELIQAHEIVLGLENAIVQVDGSLTGANARYAQFTGFFPDDELMDVMSYREFIPATADEAVAYAFENHPEIQSIMLETEAADHDIDAERATFLPDINSEFSFLERDQKDVVGGETTDARALIKANWAFSVGGRVQARTRRAEYLHKEALARSHDTMRRIESEIRESFSLWESAKRQFEILSITARKKQDLLDVYEDQFEGGNVTLIQLMQATNQLFKVKRDVVQARYQAIHAELLVIGKMGRLRDALYTNTVVSNIISEE